MSQKLRFGVFEVDLVDLDGKHLHRTRMSSHDAESMFKEAFESTRSAAVRSTGCRELFLKYKDDEGDYCMLVPETWRDALAFAKPSDNGEEGKLTIYVQLPSQRTGQEKSQAQHPVDVTAAVSKVKTELEKIADGLDMKTLVPVLAKAGLTLVGEFEQPALFPILDTLTGLADSTIHADQLDSLLPNMVEACLALPQDASAKFYARVKEETTKAANKMTEGNFTLKSIEVHLNVICDGCEAEPLIGPRYRSFVKHDFDLCSGCFNQVGRSRAEYFQVASNVEGHVAGADDIGTGFHHRGVECDVCRMFPIVGRRFKSLDHADFDLCQQCWAGAVVNSAANPAAPIPRYQEVGRAGPIPEVVARRILDDAEQIAVSPKVAAGKGQGQRSSAVEEPKEENSEKTGKADSVFEPPSRTETDLVVPTKVCAGSAGQRVAIPKGAAFSTQLFDSAGAVRNPAKDDASDSASAPIGVSTSEKESAETGSIPKTNDVAGVAHLDQEIVDEKGTESDDGSWILPGTNCMDVDEEDEWMCVEGHIPRSQEPKTDLEHVFESQGGSECEFVDFPEELGEFEDETSSARIISCDQLNIESEAKEVDESTGDVTSQVAGLFDNYGHSVRQVFRIGRLSVPVDDKPVKVNSTITLQNDGTVEWPKCIAIEHLGGDDLSLIRMPLPTLDSCEAKTVTMKFVVPANRRPGTTSRSTWAVKNSASNNLIGPALVLDIEWI